MLIEFRLGNFRSIHTPQTFSFVASKDTKHPNNLIPLEGYSLLKAAALYGANASGKSNLIKALSFMQEFIGASATRMNFGDKIGGVAPFRLSQTAQKESSLFEVTFHFEELRYTYGFSATRLRVWDEWLRVVPPGKREQTWFERRFDPSTEETTWTFTGPLKKDGELLKERTRDNALVLSTGSRENVKPLQTPFRWFDRRLWIFDLSRAPKFLELRTAERCLKDGRFQKRILRLVQDADLGIDNFHVTTDNFLVTKESMNNLEENVEFSKKQRNFFSAMRELISELRNQDELNFTRQKISTLHRRVDSEEYEQFDFEEDESNGTQRFFAIVGPLLDALEQGALVVVDELDCSMHPLLTRKLIELFQSPFVETRGAQLLFTTHDSTLLDPELFRRDQIWLAEKSHGASEFFSLYDIEAAERPRNTEAFQRNYLAGRYGGTPQFGPTFEDLTFKPEEPVQK